MVRCCKPWSHPSGDGLFRSDPRLSRSLRPIVPARNRRLRYPFIRGRRQILEHQGSLTLSWPPFRAGLDVEIGHECQNHRGSHDWTFDCVGFAAHKKAETKATGRRRSLCFAQPWRRPRKRLTFVARNGNTSAYAPEIAETTSRKNAHGQQYRRAKAAERCRLAIDGDPVHSAA